MRVVKAGINEAAIVGAMVYRMESELWPDNVGSLSPDTFRESAEILLGCDSRRYTAFVLYHGETAVGVLTMSEKYAVYAEGVFGELMEFYILPGHRRKGAGRLLLKAAVDEAGTKGWKILDVGAPEQPKWKDSLRFYQSNGFREIGPRLELEL